MKKSFLKLLEYLDQAVSRGYLRVFGDEDSLITFLFHGLFYDEKEIELGHVDPQQKVTVAILRQFIEYFLEQGYLFVSPEDVIRGLPKGKFVMITFDDGYYNNYLAVPVLQKFDVPAVFFISSKHIVENKCFWWDVLYRERKRKGVSLVDINQEIIAQKVRKNCEIEEYLIDTFGANTLLPEGDVDRPFTPSELNLFSKERGVYIGNHTANHAILTNYSVDEISEEIETCQKDIFDITGITPYFISYPNGNVPHGIVPILQNFNIKLGITTLQLKNNLPVNCENNGSFFLKRHILWGDQDISSQCAAYRSDIQLLSRMKILLKGGG